MPVTGNYRESIMSLHTFHTQSNHIPVTVEMGWDRRLQRYNLVVRRTSDASPVYDCNHDPNVSRYTDLPYFAVRLASFGIRLPRAMLRELVRDAAGNVGSREVVYGPTGDIQSDAA